MMIYNSLFDSRLRYGILAWGTARDHEISKIRALQNRVLRFITFSEFGTRLKEMYSAIEVIPLDDILYMQRAIFMHNLHYNNLQHALSKCCTQPSHNTCYASNMNFILPPTKTVRGQTSIKFTGPKVWSQIPNNLKEIAFRKPFSKQLKKDIITKMKKSVENLPPNSYLTNKRKKENKDNFDLKLIFDENDDSFIFIGFDMPNSTESDSDIEFG